MKKTIALLPLLTLLLASCGGEPPQDDKGSGEEQKKKYTIVFKDQEGNLIESKQIEEGKVPSITYEPVDTEDYDYTLLGWSTSLDGEKLDSLPSATKDAVYYAVVSKINLFLGDFLTKVNNELNALETLVLEFIGVDDTNPLRIEFNQFCATEINKVMGVQTKAEGDSIFETIKLDIKAYENAMIAKLVKDATDEINEAINPILSKLPDGKLKSDITSKYDESIDKLNEIDDLSTAKSQIKGIVDGVIDFAKTEVANTYGEVKKTVSDLIEKATADLNIKITDYLPQAMCPGYESNLVTADDVNYDLANSFVNVSNIKIGFGEQWNSVLETIDIVQEFLGYVNKGSVVSNGIAALTALLKDDLNVSTNLEYRNEYISLGMSYVNETLKLNGEFLKEVEIPGLTGVKPQINISNDTVNHVRTVKVKITEKNIIKYVISADKLQIAVSYGIDLLNKQTMLTIDNSGEETIGNIVDHTSGTVKGKTVAFDCLCDFYIGDNYVSVVGNKAGAMLASKGYINELYDKTTGKLLGYKIMETLIGEKTYHTLWFNLKDISGINSVKITDKDKNKCSLSINDTYLNGKDTVMGIKQNGLASRYYDIELRNQYFYSIDKSTNQLVKLTIQTPMMFIQEDNDKDTNYTDTPSEFFSKNDITISVATPSAVLTKIRNDYNDLIPTYKEEIAEMKTSTAIEEWLAS